MEQLNYYVNRRYTEEQIRTVLNEWKETTTDEVAKKLNLEVKDIRNIANRLRATLNRNGLNPYDYLPKKKYSNFSLYEKVVGELPGVKSNENN